MSRKYVNGTWFSIPLPSGGLACGVVARSKARAPVALGYFFGPRRDHPATITEVAGYSPIDAVLVKRFGDLGLMDGSWPVIGRSESWETADWPNPVFEMEDPLRDNLWWRLTYADTDPMQELTRTSSRTSDPRLPRSGSSNKGAIEAVLDRLLP